VEIPARPWRLLYMSDKRLFLLRSERVCQVEKWERTGHLADWTVRWLVNSLAGQLTDATGSNSFCCNYINLWIKNTALVTACAQSSKHVRLVICYVILCPHYHLIKLKLQVLLLATSVSATCPVCELTRQLLGPLLSTTLTSAETTNMPLNNGHCFVANAYALSLAHALIRSSPVSL